MREAEHTPSMGNVKDTCAKCGHSFYKNCRTRCPIWQLTRGGEDVPDAGGARANYSLLDRKEEWVKTYREDEVEPPPRANACVCFPSDSERLPGIQRMHAVRSESEG